MTAEDVAAVSGVLRSDWLTCGPEVERFEQAVAEYTGARYAVAFSSGTAALHAAVAAAGVQPGDEGIVPSLTFCATANCLIFQGGRPVFADIRQDTMTLDTDEVRRRLTSRTKVILPVDYAGHPADLEPINRLAMDRGLVVIEDACHALGAEYRGQRLGGISDMTVFSFHPVKHVTAGEGGMVVTSQRRFVDALRRFRHHGIRRDLARTKREPWYYEVSDLGWNYRLSDIACALGRSQLSRLDRNLARRRAIARRYHEAFSGLEGLTLPPESADVRHAWHLYPVRVEARRLGQDRAALFRKLRAAGLGVQVHYIPVHLHPFYQRTYGFKPGDLPVAERVYEQLISLPMFHGMSDAQIAFVIDVVRRVVRPVRKPHATTKRLVPAP